jgi:hypothetical protein
MARVLGFFTCAAFGAIACYSQIAMTQALYSDIHAFIQQARHSGIEGRLYVRWWRTTRHWQNKLVLLNRQGASEEILASARRSYIHACNNATAQLDRLEKIGAP